MCGNNDGYEGFDLVARDAVIACKTYEDWSAEWWKWAMYAPNENNPVFDDQTGASAGMNNDGPVFFIAGSGAGAGPVVREFDVPADTPVLFPMLNTIAVTWPPDPPEYLETALDETDLTMKGAHASVDGIEIAGLEDFLVRNNDFIMAGPEGSFLYEWLAPLLPEDLEPGDEYHAGSTGYWLMLKNLTPGEHTIEFGGWFDNDKNGVFEPDKGDTDVDVTAKINVVDEVAIVEEVEAAAPAESLDLLV